MSIRAVGFDIDGTLYANWQMYVYGMAPALRDLALVRAFGKARKQVRGDGPESGNDEPEPLSHENGSLEEAFERRQAGYVLGNLGIPATERSVIEMTDRIDTRLYQPWARGFRHVRPLPSIVDCFKELKERGFSIGLLS